jgi:hypothetical protein
MSLIGIGLGALVRGAATGWWTEYKSRREPDTLVMVRHGDAWRASRFIPRIQRVVEWAGNAGLACLAIAAGIAIYCAVWSPG